MGKRRPKFKRYSRKRELRLIRIIFTKGSRIARNKLRPPIPTYIPPTLVWRGDDCTVCGEELVYYMQYDWLICPTCNAGKEKGCSDPDCNYCRNRPERPLTDAEWEQWKTGELTAKELEAPDSAQTRRRVNRLKTKKMKKPRAYEKRGLKFRDPQWYRKYYAKNVAKHTRPAVDD